MIVVDFIMSRYLTNIQVLSLFTVLIFFLLSISSYFHAYLPQYGKYELNPFFFSKRFIIQNSFELIADN